MLENPRILKPCAPVIPVAGDATKQRTLRWIKRKAQFLFRFTQGGGQAVVTSKRRAAGGFPFAVDACATVQRAPVDQPLAPAVVLSDMHDKVIISGSHRLATLMQAPCHVAVCV